MSTQAGPQELPQPPGTIRAATVRVLVLTLVPVTLYVLFGLVFNVFETILSYELAGIATVLAFGGAALWVGLYAWAQRRASTWARVLALTVCGYIALMTVVSIALLSRH